MRVLIDVTYRQRPQAGRRRATVDPPARRKYRLSDRFPNIAMNAAGSEIKRLAYKKEVAAAIPVGSWTRGTLGGLFGIAEWLRVRKVVRCSECHDWVGWVRLELGITLMAKAELTAENKPPARH